MFDIYSRMIGMSESQEEQLLKLVSEFIGSLPDDDSPMSQKEYDDMRKYVDQHATDNLKEYLAEVA